ncbi:hypothetical protein KAU11_08290 [Candidatus Babeliales bacterium]|nr:hypothetical protein [Candidatus Babeliales bacterium]
MTTNEILSLSKSILLETTSEIISDANLLIFANESYKDVYKKTFAMTDVETATVTMTAGVGTLPTNFGTMYGSARDSSDNEYPEVPIVDFNREQMEQMVTVEGGELKVYPITVSSLTIRMWAKPLALSSTQDPTIDDYFHEPIVYGIVSRGHAFLQDDELATFYEQKFNNKVAEKTSTQSVYEETNQKGAVMFTYQNLL